MTPCLFQEAEMSPAFFWWRPMTPCYNFYFATNVTVRGNRRGNYACVSLFYSTAFIIVIRLVYKTLWLRYRTVKTVHASYIKTSAIANPIYFGMLATLLHNVYPMESMNQSAPFTCSRCTLRFWSLPFFKDWIYVRLRLWILLCIMSDTDSDLGNFSCHRQGWQRFWIQRMRNSRCLCVVGYLRVYRLTKTHSPYSQYPPEA